LEPFGIAMPGQVALHLVADAFEPAGQREVSVHQVEPAR
jgi:hypothetical protein